jgi:hypothetical protein
MSDANTASLAFIKEVTPGTTPATPELTALRYTGESLKFTKESVASQEIRSDRQVPDLAKVHNNPEGGYDFELSYFAFQPVAEAALFTTLNTVDIDALAVAFTTGADTIVAAASSFDAVAVGSLLKITGATEPGNNGLKRIIAKSVDGSTLTTRSGEITDTNGADTASFDGLTAINGTTKNAYTMEKGITNLNGDDFFQQFIGMLTDTLSLAIESRAVVTGSVAMLGQGSGLSDDTIDDSGLYTEAVAGDIMNGTNNVGNITYKGATATEKFKSINLDWGNNLRGKDALAVEGNFDVGLGTCDIKGAISAYFLDNDWLVDIQQHNNFALEFSVSDDAGNSIYFWFPRCKFENGDPVIEGINTDVMIEAPFQAIRDDSSGTNTGITVAVDFIPA